ncbi:MAG: hypothetical protein ACK5Z5_05955 [Neisseriaceae bacterium]
MKKYTHSVCELFNNFNMGINRRTKPEDVGANIINVDINGNQYNIYDILACCDESSAEKLVSSKKTADINFQRIEDNAPTLLLHHKTLDRSIVLAADCIMSVKNNSEVKEMFVEKARRLLCAFPEKQQQFMYLIAALTYSFHSEKSSIKTRFSLIKKCIEFILSNEKIYTEDVYFVIRMCIEKAKVKKVVNKITPGVLAGPPSMASQYSRLTKDICKEIGIDGSLLDSFPKFEELIKTDIYERATLRR